VISMSDTQQSDTRLQDRIPATATATASAPRSRALWLTIAVLTALVVIAPVAVQAYGWLIQRTVAATWSATHPVTAVSVEVYSGDVTVSPGSADTVTIHETLQWDYRKPTVHEAWQGDTLLVSTSCVPSTLFSSHDCGTSLDLKVPAGAAVHVVAHSGEVSVTGVSGAVTAQANSGDIQLTGTSGPVSAHTTSGNVTGQTLLSARVDVATGSGDVNLSFAAPPETVTSSVGSGNTSILVPRGATYRVTGQTTSGERGVDGALENGASTRSMAINSGSGDVDINYQG
jgi:Putative adhesin